MANLSSCLHVFGLCLLRRLSSQGRNVSHREHNIDSIEMEAEISLATLVFSCQSNGRRLSITGKKVCHYIDWITDSD